MLLSFFLISLIAISGLALTYLIENEEPLMWRLAAGNVIGCALYGTLTFVIACFFGLNTATAIASLGLTTALLTLLVDKKRRARLARDWNRAKGKLQGANAKKILTFCYYAFFFIVFWLFFAQAMYEMPDGIYTGGSNNLGDLPFHLGAIFSFTDGGNFPPQNPSFALFNIPWSPWCIQMMQGNHPALDVGSGAHLFSRPREVSAPCPHSHHQKAPSWRYQSLRHE